EKVSLQVEARFEARRQPGPQRRIAGQGRGQSVDTPSLEVDLAPGEEGSAVADCRRRSVRAEGGETHRAEKADGVVLDAVALPVAGDQLLVLAALRGPRRGAGRLADELVEGGGAGLSVLPDHGLPE